MRRVVASVMLGTVAVMGCDPSISKQDDDIRASQTERPGEPGDDCPVCPAGYTPVGTECVWYGGPKNGDFSEDAEWKLSGAVGYGSTSGEGFGAMLLFPDAVCTDSYVQQSFEMPTYACAEPLALSVTAFSSCAFCDASVHVDINGGRNDLRQGAPTRDICLGERAYGQTAELTISTTSPSCVGDTTVYLDDIDVWPAVTRKPLAPGADMTVPVCAPPGTIVNGDFEEGKPGWEMVSDGAELNHGYGNGATRGARLAAEECLVPSVIGTASLPMHENTENPALSLWAHGIGDGTVSVSYGGNVMGAVTTTSPQITRMCIPRWAQGVSEPLSLRLSDWAGNCASIGSEFRLDNLEVVSDPACVAGANVFDGSFEFMTADDAASSWFVGGDATVSNQHAYDGDVSLRVALSETCGSAGGRQVVTIPAGAPHPAVRFVYRTDEAAGAAVAVNNRFLEASDDGWQQEVLCLTSQRADAPFMLELALHHVGGACDHSMPAAYFDAVEVLEDAGRLCP